MLKRHLLFILLLIGAVSNLFAQQGKVDIKLMQPPPNQLGVGDLWNLELNNTSGKDMNIYLTGTASEEKDGLIIEGKSKVFIIKPGRSNYKYNDFSNAEVKYNKGKYKEIMLRTGNAPEGNYTICVTAFSEGGEVVGQENCIMQTVKQEGSITLISPENGEEVNPEQPIMFAWTPLPGAKEYTLKVYGPGKRDWDADMDLIFRKKAIFEKTGITTTTFQYPLSEKKLEAGKKYAWVVSSGEVVSEAMSFKITKPDKFQKDTSQYNITLVSPTEENPSENIKPEFKWNVKDKKRIKSYTLQIVELKGDSGLVEFNKKNILFEEKGIKKENFKYPDNAPALDTGKHYVWRVLSINSKNAIVGASLPSMLINSWWCHFRSSWGEAYMCPPFAFPPNICWRLVRATTSYEVCQGQNILWRLPIILGWGVNYSWSNSNNPNGLVIPQPTSNMTPGTYTFYYIGTCGNLRDAIPITIKINGIPTAQITTTPPLCNGGSITVENTSGGTPPYQYSLSGPTSRGWQISNVFANLSPTGTSTFYVVRIRDSKGCIAEINNITLPAVSLPPVPTIIGPSYLCNSNTPPSATLCISNIDNFPTPPTGNFSFRWMKCESSCNTNNPVFEDLPLSTGSGTSYLVQVSGKYRVRVTDNNTGACAYSNVIEVRSTYIPEITGFNQICEDNGTVQLSTPQMVGATYQWFINNSPINDANQRTYTANSAGSYTVSVSYNLCNVICSYISSPFVVTNFDCSSCACNTSSYSSLPITGITCVASGSQNGVPKYKVNFSINNNSGCPAYYYRNPITAGVSVLSNYVSQNLSSGLNSNQTFEFTTSLPSASKVDFRLNFHLLNSDICEKYLTVLIP
jgi:hypothetical protein